MKIFIIFLNFVIKWSFHQNPLLTVDEFIYFMLLQTFIIYTSEKSHSTFLPHKLSTAAGMKSMINSCLVLYDKSKQKQPTISWEVYVSGLKLYNLLYFKTIFRSQKLNSSQNIEIFRKFQIKYKKQC